MPIVGILVLGACVEDTTPIVYELAIEPVTAQNQDPFSALDVLEVWLERGEGTEVWDFGSVGQGDEAKVEGLGPLDGESVAIAGYDAGGTVVTFGRSAPVAIQDGEVTVPLFVASTHRPAHLDPLVRASFGGTLTAVGGGRFVYLGGASNWTSNAFTADTGALVLDLATPERLAFEPLTDALPEVDRPSKSPFRAVHAATLITGSSADAGKILVTGGSSDAWEWPASSATAFLLDPTDGSTEPIEPMVWQRMSHTAIETRDGILIVGGFGDQASSVVVPTIERYDPTTRTFEVLAPRDVAVQWQAAGTLDEEGTLLCGGVVLGAGSWQGVKACDRVSVDGQFVEGFVDLPYELFGAQLTALPDSATGSPRLLLTGGFRSGDEPHDYQNPPDYGVFASSTALVYQDGVWLDTAAMHYSRAGHAAVALPDGRVLVVGGTQELAEPTYLFGETSVPCAEIYDATTALWTEVSGCGDENIDVMLPVAASDLAYGAIVAGGMKDMDAQAAVTAFVGRPAPPSE